MNQTTVQPGMELYLLRHAIAVERGTSGYADDSLRPLTREGRRKMQVAAIGMKRLELVFDGLVSSPYARARETAEIVAGRFRLGRKLRFSEHLQPAGNARLLLLELKRLTRARGRWLLVGHEPDLSRLAAKLMGGSPSLGLKLKKGALCKLVIGQLRHGACAELEWLLTSRQLIQLR